jgi:hypothetical protein
MATEIEGAGDGPHPEVPEACDDAPEYVMKRLARTGGTVTPSTLADEYDCSNGHMQDTLRDLHDEGLVERVARGEYALAEDADRAEVGSDEGNGPVSMLPAGGPAQSPDTDTTAGDQGGGEDGEGVECPVDGCDFEADGPLSLRGHANSALDHNWEDVKEAMDGGGDGPGDEGAEPPEMGEPEIVDVDELEESGDDVDGPGGIPLPVSSTTLVVGVASVFLVIVLWSYLRADGSESEQQPQEGGGQDPEDPFIDDMDLVEGGA